MKNSNRIVFFNILSTVILQGLAFITSPIFSRLLGTDNYGVVSVYSTWTTLVTSVFSLNVSSSLNIARINLPEEENEKYQSSMLGLGVISYLFFGGLVLLFLKPLSAILKMHEVMIVLLIVHSFGVFCVDMLNTKFTFEFHADKNCVLSVLTAVSTVLLSLVLIYQVPAEINYWGRILGQAITYAGLAVFGCIFFFTKGKTFFKWEYWKFCLPICLPVIFHSISNLVLEQSDRIMLQHLTNDSYVGIYSLAATFGLVVHVLWLSLNKSWSPFYYEYSKEGQINEMRSRARNYIELFTVLSSGFVLLAPEVYHLFAGEDFWGGTNLIPVFALGHYFVFLYSFPVNYEFYKKRTVLVAAVTVSAALVNLVLNYFMIQSFGYLGAAIATCVSHGFQFLFHYISARFIIDRGEFPFRMGLFIPYILAFFVMTGVSFLPMSLWFVRWGIGVVLGVYELRMIIKRKRVF